MGESMKFTELDQYLFGQGTNYEVYKKLGAHPVTYRRRKGVYFAVWAPNARSVSVIGEFNNWDEEADPMKKSDRSVFMKYLCRERRSASFINFLLWEPTVNICIKQTHMPMQQRNVLAQHPELQISRIINGKIPPGSRTERNTMRRKKPWRSMRYIRVPGRNTHGQKITKKDSTITGNLPIPLLTI